eukprot:2010079-Karenia_brevis.AAC.1
MDGNVATASGGHHHVASSSHNVERGYLTTPSLLSLAVEAGSGRSKKRILKPSAVLRKGPAAVSEKKKKVLLVTAKKRKENAVCLAGLGVLRTASIRKSRGGHSQVCQEFLDCLAESQQLP